MRVKKSDRGLFWQASLLFVLIAGWSALSGVAQATSPISRAGAQTAGGNGAAPSAEKEGGTQQPPEDPAGGAEACSISDLRVTSAYRDVQSQVGSSAADKDSKLQLNDVLSVKIPGLMQRLALAACKDKKFVLYLNDRLIPGLLSSAAISQETLNFTLTPTDKWKAAWAKLLSSPNWNRSDTAVSVGLSVGPSNPLGSSATVQLPFPFGRFYAWAGLFATLFIAFLVLAKRSDVLRDVGLSPGCGARRPFSLARTQAAWWFFIILGSYLLIGVVTGDYLGSITASVLVLLGISAGTVVGGAAIDASRQSPESQAQQANVTAQLALQVNQADASLHSAQTVHDAQVAIAVQTAQSAQATQAMADAAPTNTAASQAAQLAQLANSEEVARTAKTAATVAASNADLAEKKSKLKAARNETENFLLDILSDADGVSFHRFQNAAWTIVLGIIFICAVVRDLAMPQFSDTLLGLMGISAGTYLGMKVPEPKVPTVQP